MNFFCRILTGCTVAACGILVPSNARAAAAGSFGAPDSRIKILSPLPGQVFSPGDTIDVMVEVDKTIRMVAVSVASEIGLQETATTASPAHVQLPVPVTSAGPVVLSVGVTAAVANGPSAVYAATPLKVLIKPKDIPRKLMLLNEFWSINLPQEMNEDLTLYARGIYADGIERDLSSTETGTTYTSSKPSVASVDANQNIIAHQTGVAVITAEHQGVRDFAIVVVKDPKRPSIPEDVTSQLHVERGPVRENPAPDSKFLFMEELRITNTGSIPVPGRLYVVLEKLPPDVKRWGPVGITEHIQPKDSLYADVPLPTTGLSLVPGESVAVPLEFLSPDAKSIQYELHILRAEQP